MRRLSRIFRNDGRTVIAAMDHGMGLGVLPELVHTGRIISLIAAGGADAVLTTFGIAKRYQEELKPMGLILRMDGGSSMLGSRSRSDLLYDLEDAVRMGADGVVCMGFLGTELEPVTLGNIAFLAGRCREWGMPLMAEMLPGGFTQEPAKSAENVQLACRIGAELGADIIKTVYAGSTQEFSAAVSGCYVPVVVLGGSHTPDISSLFQDVEHSLHAGGAGVAIGRNIWRHESPDICTAALVDMVHNGTSAKDAAYRLEKES